MPAGAFSSADRQVSQNPPVFQENFVGILGLTAVAASRALAVVLYRVGTSGSASLRTPTSVTTQIDAGRPDVAEFKVDASFDVSFHLEVSIIAAHLIHDRNEPLVAWRYPTPVVTSSN